ncbi:two-component system phosphate regulon response regulator PhoB [Thiogranum longum]|uniref:Phosphate regulon transcriptional regulatory protein PhoB n=2 Tax=Thiogranum longum TaxID=1537524 RepID=A0A4R1HEP6_9GAMM|nr:two-component system phosphate regulon response regulator PhoB [Thiogranum longum]
MKRILVVEDESAIREMLGFSLTKAGFRVDEVADAEQALLAIAANPPDLVLLDWMLPGMSGVDLARRLRREELTAALPVIMITARSDENDRVRGLETGADDYVTKPFSPRELVARIQAVLRRTSPESGQEVVQIGGLALNPVDHRVLADETEIELAPTEFRLLSFFMRHPDRVYSREQLLDRVWGRGIYVEERTVDVHIRRLRKALASCGCDRFIQTVRGAGYRFSDKAKV